jgi:hypothetical protein
MTRSRLLISSCTAALVACTSTEVPRPSPRLCPSLAEGAPLPSDTAVYDTLRTSPRPRRLASPPIHSFPGSRRRAGFEGEATAVFTVDKSGRVEPHSARVVFTTDSLLVPPTLEAATRSSYCPGARDGHPVRTRKALLVRYSGTIVDGGVVQIYIDIGR